MPSNSKVTLIDNSFKRKYSPVHISDVDAENYNQHLISHMSDALNEYDLLLIHRVLKQALKKPPHIKKRQELKSPLNVYYIEGDWVYYLQNQNNVLFKILSDTRKKQLSIYILSTDTKQAGKELLSKDGSTFAKDLLNEIKNNRHLLPLKKNNDFIEGEEVWMENVFLKNYSSASALFMSGIFDNEELIDHYMNNPICKWQDHSATSVSAAASDPGVSENDRESVIYDLETIYARASVQSYFIALEGFLNMIYHIMIRRPLRNLMLEMRLDWELKYALMPYLCHGFTNSNNAMLKDEESRALFNKLKKYRNVLFHSKVSETLYDVYPYEDQLRYSVDLDNLSEDSMPHKSGNIGADTAIEVQTGVDYFVQHILNSMDERIRDFATFVFTEMERIPLIKDKEGMVYFPYLTKGD